MTRRSLLTAALSLQAAESPDELEQRAVAFEIHWNLFLRRLFGCPDTGDIGPGICKAHLRQIDRKEFARARDAAKKLFDLKEK